MVKSTSLLSKAAPAAKKKTSKYYRPFWIFLMYFMQLRYRVKGLIAFLLSFYDQCRCNTQTIDVLLMLFCLASIKKASPLSPTTSVDSAALTLTVTSSLLSLKGSLMPPSFLPSSSSFSLIVKLTQQLFVETPHESTKLPSHLINWLSIKDIRRKLEKHNKRKVTGNKIEDNMLSLLTKFAPGEIRFALVATLAKLELDVKDLPARKSQLIEVFLQLIFDKMSILVNLTKSADRYV
jgi:hypothetical protein